MEGMKQRRKSFVVVIPTRLEVERCFNGGMLRLEE
jgi:hypothetical protein